MLFMALNLGLFVMHRKLTETTVIFTLTAMLIKHTKLACHIEDQPVLETVKR